jgi:hypothetical protein
MNDPTSHPITNNILPDQRNQLRFPCAADVDISTLDGYRRLAAGVSTLSLDGCYVDSPDSLDVGTQIRLSLRDGERECTLSGTVIYVHRGWGMGIQFGELDATQKTALEECLLDLCLRMLTGVGPKALRRFAPSLTERSRMDPSMRQP